MAYIAGSDRTQVVLLPEVLDDYVTADNPVRFLDAFVAQLDLGALSFQRSVPRLRLVLALQVPQIARDRALDVPL